jgi:hypothetical protein
VEASAHIVGLTDICRADRKVRIYRENLQIRLNGPTPLTHGKEGVVGSSPTEGFGRWWAMQ